AGGTSHHDMDKAFIRAPGSSVSFGCMMLAAATELAPGQWVDLALTNTTGMPGILVLVYVSGLMFVMRHFAGRITRFMPPVGLLWWSSLIAAIGLYGLSIAQSPALVFRSEERRVGQEARSQERSC